MRQLYPRGQIKKSSEGLITVGSETVIDPVTYTVGLIYENWKPQWVDDRATIVDKEENWKGADYLDQDYVLVQREPGSEQLVSLGGTHSNQTIRLHILFLSKDNDAHFEKLVAAVRRIVMTYRRAYFRDANGDPIHGMGVSWVKWGVTDIPRDRITRGHKVRVISIEIRRRWVPVVTDVGV